MNLSEKEKTLLELAGRLLTGTMVFLGTAYFSWQAPLTGRWQGSPHESVIRIVLLLFPFAAGILGFAIVDTPSELKRKTEKGEEE